MFDPISMAISAGIWLLVTSNADYIHKKQKEWRINTGNKKWINHNVYSKKETQKAYDKAYESDE